MKRKNVLFIIGILLSVLSKWLQLQYGSLWGDVLILPAAVFFVLAILLNIPQYQSFLENPKQQQSAKFLAAYACATVVSFQLFTMFTFGRGESWGMFFVLLVLLFAGLSLYQWRSLTKTS